MINALKNMGILMLIIGACQTLGTIMNYFLPWEYLTIFFKLIRDFLDIFDFIIDIDTFIYVLGMVFTVEISIATYRAVLKLINLSGLNR